MFVLVVVACHGTPVESRVTSDSGEGADGNGISSLFDTDCIATFHGRRFIEARGRTALFIESRWARPCDVDVFTSGSCFETIILGFVIRETTRELTTYYV